jgi:hypothetical protein
MAITEVTGAFALADPDGIDDLTHVQVSTMDAESNVVSTAEFSMTQLQTVASTGTPLSIADTTAGELFITDYDATTGEVDYRYVLDTAITQSQMLINWPYLNKKSSISWYLMMMV